MIRCYNEDNNLDPGGCEFLIESPFNGQVITDIVQIETPGKDGHDCEASKKIRNLVMCLDNGRLYTYGLYPYLRDKYEINVMNSHHGRINMLRKSHDNKIMVSCGKDGTVFVYRVTETHNKNVGSWSRKLDSMREKYDIEARAMISHNAKMC